jgi:hypothetical protein
MRCFKIMGFVAILLVYLFTSSPTSLAELIEPTQTLKGKQEDPGRLTVLSEPPGLKIALDDNSLGKTPAFLVEVDAGIHTLRVKDSKIQIYIKPGKTLKISLHKDKFIFIPVAEKEDEQQPEIKTTTGSREAEFTRPRDPVRIQAEKNRRNTIKRFNKFLDGTQETF